MLNGTLRTYQYLLFCGSLSHTLIVWAVDGVTSGDRHSFPSTSSTDVWHESPWQPGCNNCIKHCNI